MSHLTTQLCEKYAGEPIPEWEYDLEAKEWAAIGFFPTAFAGGVKQHLPKSSFFSSTASKQDVLSTWTRIKQQLGRTVRLECTIGLSFGKDLDPFGTPPAATQPPATHNTAPSEDNPAHPGEDALSAAFNKLFKPIIPRPMEPSAPSSFNRG